MIVMAIIITNNLFFTCSRRKKSKKNSRKTISCSCPHLDERNNSIYLIIKIIIIFKIYKIVRNLTKKTTSLNTTTKTKNKPFNYTLNVERWCWAIITFSNISGFSYFYSVVIESPKLFIRKFIIILINWKWNRNRNRKLWLFFFFLVLKIKFW